MKIRIITIFKTTRLVFATILSKYYMVIVQIRGPAMRLSGITHSRSLKYADNPDMACLLHPHSREQSLPLRRYGCDTLFHAEERGNKMTVWDIKTLPLFAGLSPNQIHSIIGSFSLVKYQKGEHICEFGDYGQDIFIIVKGCVKVVSGTGVVLGYLNERDVFGEIGFVYGVSRSATVAAEEETVIAILDKTLVENVSQTDPALKTVLIKNILLSMSKKLTQANSMIELITNGNIKTPPVKHEVSNVKFMKPVTSA